MSPFNDYGNIQDQITKDVREAIYKLCAEELNRLLSAGASIQVLKAVTRDYIGTIDIACSEIIITEQARKRNGFRA
jgi:hypothetical protein